ncbi:SIMPL domain-containing protein [Shewanella sp. KX20019]|uniref:SIMPL domain-containing protein n=1 Tax=Shewanella sp. KX20019 TaxID=2803864 RepID=UPI001928F638|nr:SIMPL domain-containing protein [Shewanella sp. KX20019]QQX78301.1 SIMPL domain-containing protein [Shewanella sp. KX20019]
MKRILILLLSLLPLSGNASSMPHFPFVIVNEEIEKQVKPDIATLSFSLMAFNKESKLSIEALSRSTAQVLALLKKYKIQESQLVSSQIYKSAERARKDGAYNLDILGYSVMQMLTLELMDLSLYPKLMVELLMIDGLEDIDSEFKSTKKTEIMSRLLSEVSTKARKKADALAKGQSRQVKSVYGITTKGSFDSSFDGFSLNEIAYSYSAGSTNKVQLVMAIPETITISQTILAIYELK